MEAHSIGIIGGADGPTVIMVAGNALPVILLAAALIGAVIAVLVLTIRHFRKRK